MITEADIPTTPRPAPEPPLAENPGVTPLGDAAHLMSPFAGEAPTWLADATDLAEAIMSDPNDPEHALRGYETTMFERSTRAAEESAAT